MIRTCIAAAIAVTALAGPAPSLAAAPETGAAPAKAARQCFFTRSITGFNAPNDRTVNLRVGVNDVYRLDLLGPCPDVTWNNQIAVVSRGSSSICSGMDATVISKSNIGSQRCAVRTVSKLTPAEVAALPRNEKP